MGAKLTCSVIGAVALVGMIAGDVLTTYQYDRQIGSFWKSSVKASTLDKKADYLNQFVAAIEAAKLSGYTAIVIAGSQLFWSAPPPYSKR